MTKKSKRPCTGGSRTAPTAGKFTRVSDSIFRFWGQFLAAAIYAVFAVYLYRPYFHGFSSPRLQDLFVINVSLASLGCYMLSRRWIAGFTESLFAGAIYGFGPFALGLAKFHPSAGFLFASIPWLFCPAVFGPKGKYKPLRMPLSLLPFLAIPLFFKSSAAVGLYPIPIKLKLNYADLAGLLAPLVAAKRNMTLVGFYHIPVASLIMGVSVFLGFPFCRLFAKWGPLIPLEGLSRGSILQRAKFLKGLTVRRLGIAAIFIVATILAFCESFFDVSPVIWLAISMLFCSVLIGLGMQGFIYAGFDDRKWILFAAIVMGIFAIITLLLATKYFQIFAGLGSGYARLLTETAKMYVLGAITIAIFFFTARAKLFHRIPSAVRLTVLLKTGLLCATMGLDIFLGARFIVDTIL
jgi:hypothetical protein